MTPKLLVGAAVLCALPVFAARPLQTDDAGVIGEGGCELEASRDVARAAGASAGATGIAFGCGIGWNSQIGLAHDRASAGGESARAWSLVGKSQLWDGGEAGALSLGWSVAWLREGGRHRHAATEAVLIGTRAAGPVNLHLNLGHARDEITPLRSTTWGFAVESAEWQAGPFGWAPMGEVFGDDRGDRWAAAGLRVTVLPERLFLDVAWRRQLVADKAREWSAGLKWAF